MKIQVVVDRLRVDPLIIIGKNGVGAIGKTQAPAIPCVAQRLYREAIRREKRFARREIEQHDRVRAFDCSGCVFAVLLPTR